MGRQFKYDDFVEKPIEPIVDYQTKFFNYLSGLSDTNALKPVLQGEKEFSTYHFKLFEVAIIPGLLLILFLAYWTTYCICTRCCHKYKAKDSKKGGYLGNLILASVLLILAAAIIITSAFGFL